MTQAFVNPVLGNSTPVSDGGVASPGSNVDEVSRVDHQHAVPASPTFTGRVSMSTGFDSYGVANFFDTANFLAANFAASYHVDFSGTVGFHAGVVFNNFSTHPTATGGTTDDTIASCHFVHNVVNADAVLQTGTQSIGGHKTFTDANTDVNGRLDIGGALAHKGGNLGFFNGAVTTQRTVTGSRTPGGATFATMTAPPALTSALIALDAYNLIVNSSTA